MQKKKTLLALSSALALAAWHPAILAMPIVFNYSGAQVTWSVPVSGLFQITAYGAQGGDSISTFGTTTGGLGAGGFGGGGRGGGSFNTGDNQILLSGVRSGDGLVQIEEISTAVPEPASLGLFAIGDIAAFAARQANRRN